MTNVQLLHISSLDDLKALSLHGRAYEWGPAHDLHIDHKGMILFPMLEKVPGIYRITLHWHDHESVYIGESKNLRARINHGYASDDETSPSTVRIRSQVSQALQSGRVATIEVLRIAEVRSPGATYSIDLLDMQVRRSVENELIVQQAFRGSKLLNVLTPKVPDPLLPSHRKRKVPTSKFDEDQVRLTNNSIAVIDGDLEGLKSSHPTIAALAETNTVRPMVMTQRHQSPSMLGVYVPVVKAPEWKRRRNREQERLLEAYIRAATEPTL